MNKRFIIVKNGTQNPVKAIRIEELHQIIPADGKFYKLPYEIAYRYREQLVPIKTIIENDDYAGEPLVVEESPVVPTVQAETITKPIAPTKKKTAKKKKRPAAKRKPVVKKPEPIVPENTTAINVEETTPT